MRICHIITRFVRGGADENTLYSCNGQAHLGHEVHLVYGSEHDLKMLDQIDKHVFCHEIKAFKRNISPFQDICALISMIYLLKEIRPELVHTHTSKAGILGRVAAKISCVQVIIHGIHILPFVNVKVFSRTLYKWLELSVAGFTDAFISVGEEMRQTCIEAGIGTADRHFVVGSGMDINKFRRAVELHNSWRSVLPDTFISPPNPRFLVLVSRLERRKGQIKFLPFFKELTYKFPDIVLLIVGEGPDKPILEKEISTRGLEGRVILTGFRPDVERVMALADIGILTSAREGLARVLLQYALLGLPIVATDIPGAREIVDHAVNGYLVPYDDLAQMLPYIESLIKDEKLRTKMSMENIKLNLSSWSVDDMLMKLENIYQSSLQKKLQKRLM